MRAHINRGTMHDQDAADVFVQNLGPGAAARAELDSEALVSSKGVAEGSTGLGWVGQGRIGLGWVNSKGK